MNFEEPIRPALVSLSKLSTRECLILVRKITEASERTS